MNRTRDATTDPVVECAATFVAKVYSGEISDADVSELENWLAEDIRHREEYEAVLEAWDFGGLCNTDDGTNLGGPEIEATRRSYMSGYKIAAGFAVCLFALTAYFYGADRWRGDTGDYSEYETVVGEQRTVQLPDSSRITLNTDTKIVVDFSGRERNLTLEFGEAYFDIAKDPARAFVIDFRERRIKVLGTKFNVHLTASAATVAVIEGVVAVGDGMIPDVQQMADVEESIQPYRPEQQDQQILLKAGKKAVFSVGDNGVGSVVETDMDVFRDWRSGQVRFDRESLINVVAELNRYSNLKVLIEDPKVIAFEVSGVFQLDKIDLFLQGIDEVLPVEIVQYSDRYVIVSEKVHLQSIADPESSGLEH